MFINLLFQRGLLHTDRHTIDDHLKKQLLKAYEFAEKFLEGKAFVAGNTPTIADMSFASSISSWTTMVSVEDGNYPNITAWLRRVEKLPWYEANVEGLGHFKAIVDSKLNK